MRNVFEIWNDNKKQLPIYVRRWNWSVHSVFEVTRVNIKEEYYRKTGKLYGIAWGRFHAGVETETKKEKETKMNCPGCYQWEQVFEEEFKYLR